MHFTFWQPTPSLHQRGLMEALVCAPWVKSVRLRYETPLSPDDLTQDRHGGVFAGVDIAPIAEGENPVIGTDQVHVFSGILTHVTIASVLKRVPEKAPCVVLAYAEAPDLTGFSGLGRRIIYYLAFLRLRYRLDAVLALGELGEKYYSSLLSNKIPVREFFYYDRVEKDRLVIPDRREEKTESPAKLTPEKDSPPIACEYEGLEIKPISSESEPFPDFLNKINLIVSGFQLKDQSLGFYRVGVTSPGFVVQVPKQESVGLKDVKSIDIAAATYPSGSRHPAPMLGKIGAVQPNTRRLLYVGEITWSKGLDNLLIALASLRPSTPPWILDVIGDGSELPFFIELAESLDLVDKVRFRPKATGASLDRHYLRADLVILPSRWDGWGMAVNEALFAGVPVAATDRCGAASFIKNLPGCTILPANRTKRWPDLIAECLVWGIPIRSDRVRLQKAAERLTGEAGAEILQKTIEQASKRRKYLEA